jgi:mannosyltransferase
MSHSNRSNSIPNPADPGRSPPRTASLPAFLKRLPRLDAENSAERTRATLFYGGLLVLVAAFMRFASMATEPFWHDEITMLNLGLGGWDEVVTQFYAGRPPVFVAISYVWTALFGTGEIISRIPSFIASVASVAVLFYLGSLMFNQRVGFLAALVMTVTEFHLYYAQTFRYYAVYVLMILLSYLFFYLMLKRGHRAYTVLYVLFTALALYTHAHGMFAIASQAVFFVVMLVLSPQWRNRRLISRWLGSQVLLGLIVFPGLWLYFIADLLVTAPESPVVGVVGAGGDVGIGWLGEPTPGSIVRTLVRFLFYEWYYLNPHGILTALLFIVVGVAFYVSKLGWLQWGKAVRQLPRDLVSSLPNRLPEWWLVTSWFLGMLMLPWVLSFLVIPMFFDRYVLGASPAYYLLLILLLFSIRRVIPLQVMMIAFLVSLIPGLIAFYALPDNEKWNEVASYVNANRQSSDAIVILTSGVHRGQMLEAFDWYSPSTATCELYEDQLDDEHTIARLTDCLANHDRAWLVGLRWSGDVEQLDSRGLSSTLEEFFETYDSGHWQLVETREGGLFYLLGVYLYENASS